MQALSIDNLPTPKEERWKYTNLPRAVPDGLKATAADEFVLKIPRGEVRENPVEKLWSGAAGMLHYPVMDIELGDNAQAVIIERHDGSGAYWKNMVSSIKLGQGARLTHIRIQQDSFDAVHTNMAEITLGRDAVYDGFSLNLGGKLSRHEIRSALTGAGGEIHFNGLNLLKGQQHGDTTILIEHQAPNCNSNQFYRTLLGDAAHGVFQGKVHVHQIAQKTDGYQLSNAILLSDKAIMDTKPELEIYADDVKCSHGATTGRLNDEPMFYLRSRGLSEAEARLLLVRAFVDEVVDKIGDESLQGMVFLLVEEWLGHVL